LGRPSLRLPCLRCARSVFLGADHQNAKCARNWLRPLSGWCGSKRGRWQIGTPARRIDCDRSRARRGCHMRDDRRRGAQTQDCDVSIASAGNEDYPLLGIESGHGTRVLKPKRFGIFDSTLATRKREASGLEHRGRTHHQVQALVRNFGQFSASIPDRGLWRLRLVRWIDDGCRVELQPSRRTRSHYR
jgi:hypothetical protein